jgi:hypothetical protein
VRRKYLRTAVGFDLDSTLCDTRHRWGLSPMADPESTWDVYCAARLGDAPILGTVTTARLFYLTNQIHIWSGSEATSDAVTRTWLSRHRVPFDDLRQRPEGDHRPNAELKISFILDLRERGIETVLYYEDMPDVATEIYDKTGTPVVVVNPCYPEDEEKFRRGPYDGRGGGL